MDMRKGQSGDAQQPLVLMGQVLMMAPESSDVLNGDVLNRLDRVWVDTPAQDVAAMGVFGLAQQLMAILPDGEGFGNELRLKIAEELIELLGRFGITSSPAPAATVTTVRIERNYDEMSLRQLLEQIIVDPDSYAEAVRYIRAHREVQAAAAKTHQWVVPNESGGIDLEVTVRYVTELSKPHSVPQSRVNDRRPVSLDRAMGVNDQPLIHPITGRLVQGPDENGFNWSEIDAEIIESVIWARRIGHRMLPDFTSDVFGWSEQLFQKSLPRRFQEILDDYRQAKTDRLSTVDGIRAFWPEDLSHDSVFTFFAAVKVVDYEALVREAATMAAPLHLSGTGASTRGGVYTTIRVSGTRASITDMVVVDGGTVSGTGVFGTVYMPPGMTLRVSGTRADVRVVNQTWKQLAERLRLI